MKVAPILAITLALISLPACDMHKEEAHHEQHKIVVTSPYAKDVTITQQYVCLIRSQKHFEVCALMGGYLKRISLKEGQAVTKDQVLFQILPTLYEAKMNAEAAEAKVAKIEFDNTKKLFNYKPVGMVSGVVSQAEVNLYEAKLARAQAKADLAKAEFDFATIRAPFDGIVDRLYEQQGSLIKEGDVLTTMFDNGVMWVYFNVPEARYLEYKDSSVREKEYAAHRTAAGGRQQVQARPARSGRSTAKFNNETGNIKFRADFPNPDGLLRHGMTGKVLIHRTLKNAIVIPQRATFEILDKRYVFVVDKDDKAHQREIIVQNELDDIYVIKKGLGVGDKFVFEGIRQVHDGEKVEYEFRPPGSGSGQPKTPRRVASQLSVFGCRS